MSTDQERILAVVIFEIRVQLAEYLGTRCDAPMQVRLCAHLAYALHNEALSILAGGTFSPTEVLAKLKAIDGILGVEDGHRICRAIETSDPISPFKIDAAS